MKISNDLINIIEAALDTLIKASGMDLRLHGLENVPDHPVLYVINHFTRIETILMPYIIKKNIAQMAIFGSRSWHIRSYRIFCIVCEPKGLRIVGKQFVRISIAESA